MIKNTIPQGCYNAKAIDRLNKKGKAAAWKYIKTMPKANQAGAISTLKLITKRVR